MERNLQIEHDNIIFKNIKMKCNTNNVHINDSSIISEKKCMLNLYFIFLY